MLEATVKPNLFTIKKHSRKFAKTIALEQHYVFAAASEALKGYEAKNDGNLYWIEAAI